MSANRGSLTDLLRVAIASAESYRSIERDTGIKRQSLMTFMRGKTTLRLDAADKLATYFGIESRFVSRRKR